MVNQPETPEQGPFGRPQKLVLPAPPGEEYSSAPPAFPPRMTAPISPEYLIHRQSAPPPQGPLARLRYLWHKDPAYKVLLIAVVVVLVAGTVFAALIGNALVRNTSFYAANSTTPLAPPKVPATINPRPTFAPPSGGKGSKSSSLPPAHGPTPDLQTTPDASADPTPADGTLTIDITSIPTSVQNFQTVAVKVSASAPNVTVYLSVKYSVSPRKGFAGPAITDDNGNATLNWLVVVYKTSGGRASVVAIAKDQNGQQAQSQTVSVHIGGSGG
jgi:hypothetical protein